MPGCVGIAIGATSWTDTIDSKPRSAIHISRTKALAPYRLGQMIARQRLARRTNGRILAPGGKPFSAVTNGPPSMRKVSTPQSASKVHSTVVRSTSLPAAYA